MSSSRLPGKALIEFGSRPLLAYVVEAAASVQGISQVMVVTSRESSDDPIARWCESNNVDVWRGSLNDVAARMLAAADSVGADSLVRVSGDSPMIDPGIISFAVQRFKRLRPDLVTNVRPRSFPAGQSVEVIRTRTLKRLLESSGDQPGDREHVTPVLYRHESEIWIDRFTPSDMRAYGPSPRGPYRSMTVDTPEDAACFDRVIRDLGDTCIWKQGWEHCEELMRAADAESRTSLGEEHA